MARAHLIMNPEARGVNPALQRVVVAALEARFKVDSTETHARDAGIEVARRAAQDGVEYVIAFGGDGLVNEVVNGLAGSDCVLGIIPGGTMNVFARNLGIPAGVVEAADRILSALDGLVPRSVELASANGRLFTFACGCGFDAEAAAIVEAHKSAKRIYGEPFFYAAAFATFVRSYMRKRAFLRARGDFGSHEGVLAIVVNGGPYAYLFGRPVRLLRKGNRDGVDLFMLEKMNWWRVPEYIGGVLATHRYGAESITHLGVQNLLIESERPFALHVDGEPLPEVEGVSILAGADRQRVIV